MTILLLVLFFVSLASIVVGSFPLVTELPFGLDSLLLQAVGMYNQISVWIPPLGIMLDGFLVIMLFKGIMMILHLLRIIR